MFSLHRNLALLLMLIMLPALIRCDVRRTPPLTIASHVWPGYELMFLARREGWLPQQGLILQETTSATASLQALTEGKADGAALTLDEVLRARAQGIALTVVLVFDMSVGADQVLGKPGIDSLNKLVGKRIGVEQSALGALMLFKTLAAAKLKPTDVLPVPLNINDHLDAWHDGKVDALITYEPVAGKLLNQDARLLFDSRKLPNTIFDVLAVRTDALQSNPAAVKALVAGHLRALKHLRGNPLDAAYRMAERLQVPGNQVLNTFRGIDLPDLYANRKLLAASDSPLLNVAQTLSTLMVKEHFIARGDALAQLISADYLPQED
ncbi:MAG: ABC transporter substrate-binding protein [Methylovulum sp.]|nr:ABC transporter substrate-binding protein [Methylovulum sp.]